MHLFDRFFMWVCVHLISFSSYPNPFPHYFSIPSLAADAPLLTFNFIKHFTWKPFFLFRSQSPQKISANVVPYFLLTMPKDFSALHLTHHLLKISQLKEEKKNTNKDSSLTSPPLADYWYPPRISIQLSH